MESNTTRYKLALDPERLQYIESLLARYPQLSTEEEAAILRFLKKAPALDVGLLSAVEGVKPQLDQFKFDHRKEFELGPTHYLWALLILVALAGLCTWLWDSGLKP